LADKAEALTPIIEFEGGLLQDQLDAAKRRVEALELDELASETIYEELGFRLDEPDPEAQLNAADNLVAAAKAYGQWEQEFVVRGGRGHVWAQIFRYEADALIAGCEGRVRGIKISWFNIVVPLPFGLGKEYCGSRFKDHGRFATEMAEVTIMPIIKRMEPEKPQDFTKE